MSIPADPKLANISTKSNIKKFYVWELPIRIFHWVNAITGTILFLTGLYFAMPFLGASSEHADGFLMGWMRYVHFYAAFIFTLNLVYRLYWSIKGNRYAKSNPFTKRFWKDVWKFTKYYMFIGKIEEEHVGHNALAQLTYWIFVGFGSVLMLMTGYYLLFEIQIQSSLGSLFAWVPEFFGGTSRDVRSWHSIVAWLLVIFSLLHLYMASRDSFLSKNETLTSIFTGYKKVSKDFKGDHK